MWRGAWPWLALLAVASSFSGAGQLLRGVGRGAMAAAARSELPRVSARPALTRASPHSTSSEDGEEPAAREGSGGRARARGRNRSGRGRSPEPTEPERAHPPLLVEHPEPRCESLIKQSARITSLVEP